MSADELGEGRSEEIRTVDEVRVVVVLGDAFIIGDPLVLVGAVHGDSGGIAGIAGDGKGGDIRRHSHVQGSGQEPSTVT